MITTVLADDPGLAGLATAFATALTGRAPDEVRSPLAAGPPGAVRPDVVVAASRADAGRPAALVHPDLSGALAFALVVGGAGSTGGWPLVAALVAAGARCPAPALHVAGPPQDPAAAIACYCRYWRPAVTALVAAGRDRRPAA